MAGDSGFHMKGNAYVGVQQHADRTVAGGAAAVVAGLRDPALRDFFAQSFFPGTWYDILPIEPFTRAAAAVAGKSHQDYCRALADFMVQRDSTGVYKALLRFASPNLLVRGLSFTTKRYFDFVQLDVVQLEPRSYRVKVQKIPRAVVATYQTITQVFITRALEGSGGKNVVAESTLPTEGPVVSGVPTMQFERVLRWDH